MADLPAIERDPREAPAATRPVERGPGGRAREPRDAHRDRGDRAPARVRLSRADRPSGPTRYACDARARDSSRGDPTTMTKIGYAAMLEQFHPTDLLDCCAAAEAAGFDAGFMVSEHFHPWTPQQGASAFAWAFMGALGQRTTLPFGTAVTCPGFRYHPAVIAHAAATLGTMYPGRFYLGLGRGRGAQRARHRRGLARGPDPQRDDVRGRSRSSTSCSPARSSGTTASTSRSSARSSTPGPRRRCRSTSPRPARSTRRRPASSPTGSSPSAPPTRRCA